MRVPIVERVIESRHALMGHGIRQRVRVRSAAKASLSSGRLQEFKARLAMRPGTLMEVATELER
eukprot:5699451-Alexandrium_andersonii.AAC.1